jgi:hypothetical protein
VAPATSKEKKPKTITIEIDGDPFEVEDREMTLTELLALVDLDPDQSYLIEQKGQGQEVEHLDPNDSIKLHKGSSFLTGDRGPGQFA